MTPYSFLEGVLGMLNMLKTTSSCCTPKRRAHSRMMTPYSFLEGAWRDIQDEDGSLYGLTIRGRLIKESLD